jgi:hypothetical protein
MTRATDAWRGRTRLAGFDFRRELHVATLESEREWDISIWSALAFWYTSRTCGLHWSCGIEKEYKSRRRVVGCVIDLPHCYSNTCSHTVRLLLGILLRFARIALDAAETPCNYLYTVSNHS